MQGLPVCEAAAVEFAVPWTQSLMELSSAQKQRLAGNSMHAQMVTQFLLYVLGHVQLLRPHAAEDAVALNASRSLLRKQSRLRRDPTLQWED